MLEMTLMNIEKLFFMFTIEVIRKYLPLNSTDKTSSFYCSLLQLLSLLKLKWHWQHQEKRWGSFPSSNFIAPPPKKCFEIGMIEQQQQQHFIASFCSIEMQVCIFLTHVVTYLWLLESEYVLLLLRHVLSDTTI